MSDTDIVENLKRDLGGKALELANPDRRRIFLKVAPADLVAAAALLRDRYDCAYLATISGVNTGEGKPFEFLYHFASPVANINLRIEVPKGDARFASICGVIPTLCRGVRFAASGVTVGSTASIFEFIRSEQCYLWEETLVPHAPGTSANVIDPGFVQPVFSLPWGGTSLPVFYQNDPRVHSCSSYVGFYDNNVMQLVHGLGQKWDAEYKNLPKEHARSR